jgi:hypothetical protein
MKHALALSMMLLLGLLPAAAADLKLTADIPFAFEVAGKVLPAGAYNLYEVNPNAMVIREVDARHSAICLVNHGAAPKSKDARLVFNRYGDQVFLSAIMREGTASTVIKSKAERVLIARQAAASHATILARRK